MSNNKILLIDLPSDIIYKIYSKLSIITRMRGRETCKFIKDNINYMRIRIDKFSILFTKIMTPFPIFDQFYLIQTGLLIDWYTRWVSRISIKDCYKTMGDGKYFSIKEFIYKYFVPKEW